MLAGCTHLLVTAVPSTLRINTPSAWSKPQHDAVHRQGRTPHGVRKCQPIVGFPAQEPAQNWPSQVGAPQPTLAISTARPQPIVTGGRLSAIGHARCGRTHLVQHKATTAPTNWGQL